MQTGLDFQALAEAEQAPGDEQNELLLEAHWARTHCLEGAVDEPFLRLPEAWSASDALEIAPSLSFRSTVIDPLRWPGELHPAALVRDAGAERRRFWIGVPAEEFAEELTDAGMEQRFGNCISGGKPSFWGGVELGVEPPARVGAEGRLFVRRGDGGV